MTLESRRGRIAPPNLDDRTWQDLVDEMRALIPVYAPQWTDHNPSDLGVTLIELFAWLGESMIYRLNQTPDRNYLAFLNLLGVTRDPPTPAYTHLTFTASAGPKRVPAGTQAQTAADPEERPVVFETDEDVMVLPTNLTTALEVGPYQQGGAAEYSGATASLVGPPAGKHLLTVPAHRVLQVCLGFDRRVDDEIAVALRLYRPAPPNALALTWVYSKASAEPAAWPPVPGAADGTGGLRRDGSVRLKLPADWTAQRPTAPPGVPPGPVVTWSTTKPHGPADTDTRFWIGARITNDGESDQVVGVERVLFNSALARTALTIRAPEILGRSTGAPFQIFSMAGYPLFTRPDADVRDGGLTIEVGVDEPPVWQRWTRVDDLPPQDAPVYRVNPVTGEVGFGNYDPRARTGRGAVPPANAVVRATTYRYVASGAAGNVRAGQVSSLATMLTGAVPPGVSAVVNLGPGLDGADEESLEETLQRAPEQLKIRDRAVTADDYEFLAREATNEIRITRCLPPRLLADGTPWAFGQITRAPGTVNVVVVPDQGPTVPRPEPTADQLRLVRGYLEVRRDLTAHLQVHGPRYLPIRVIVKLVVWQQALLAGADMETVKSDTMAAIRRFLHPARGGPDGLGWQVGQPVFTSDVFRAIMPPADLGYIENLQLQPDIPAYHFPPINPSGTSTNYKTTERPYPITAVGASVRVADYELVCAPLSDAAHTYEATEQTD
jgi:Baseplate J-like protein